MDDDEEDDDDDDDLGGQWARGARPVRCSNKCVSKRPLLTYEYNNIDANNERNSKLYHWAHSNRSHLRRAER